MWVIIIIAVVVFVFIVFPKKKKQNSDIIRRVEMMEKEQHFKTYYEKFKNNSISQLNDQIELNKKDNYEDYSVEDKMKFKAQKTLIAQKLKEEWNSKINNTINSTKVNSNLLDNIQNDYKPVSEIDSIVRSIKLPTLVNSYEHASNIDLYQVKQKEVINQIDAVSDYSDIISSENLTILTCVNVAKRISIILGKEKLHSTNYFFLAKVWLAISEFHNMGNKINVDVYEIAERLIKAEKKLSK